MQTFPQKLKAETVDLIKQIVFVTLTLFKIMIPILILIKGLEELGVIVWIAKFFAPLMQLLGLPGEASLVWVTTLFSNIYGGLLVFFTSSLPQTLTVAQVTVLGGLMLTAHGILIEGSIAKRIGMTWKLSLLLRLGGALLYGMLLNLFYQAGDWLQYNKKTMIPVFPSHQGWQDWALVQLNSLWMIFLIITVLLTLLRILRILHIERLLEYVLKPILKLFGIGERASYIIVVGTTLGLSFGGGILIREADSNYLQSKDVFASLVILSLSHGLIEDTLLILLMGAHISGAFWLKLLFSLLVSYFIIRFAQQMRNNSPQLFKRFLFSARQP